MARSVEVGGQLQAISSSSLGQSLWRRCISAFVSSRNTSVLNARTVACLYFRQRCRHTNCRSIVVPLYLRKLDTSLLATSNTSHYGMLMFERRDREVGLRRIVFASFRPRIRVVGRLWCPSTRRMSERVVTEAEVKTRQMGARNKARQSVEDVNRALQDTVGVPAVHACQDEQAVADELLNTDSRGQALVRPMHASR